MEDRLNSICTLYIYNLVYVINTYLVQQFNVLWKCGRVKLWSRYCKMTSLKVTKTNNVGYLKDVNYISLFQTNSLDQSPSGEANSFSAFLKIPRIFRNPVVLYCVTQQLVTCPCRKPTNPALALIPYYFNIFFKTIFWTRITFASMFIYHTHTGVLVDPKIPTCSAGITMHPAWIIFLTFRQIYTVLLKTFLIRVLSYRAIKPTPYTAVLCKNVPAWPTLQTETANCPVLVYFHGDYMRSNYPPNPYRRDYAGTILKSKYVFLTTPSNTQRTIQKDF
jgi:hypothetical protein